MRFLPVDLDSTYLTFIRASIRTSQYDEIDVRENLYLRSATKSEISGGFK